MIAIRSGNRHAWVLCFHVEENGGALAAGEITMRAVDRFLASMLHVVDPEVGGVPERFLTVFPVTLVATTLTYNT